MGEHCISDLHSSHGAGLLKLCPSLTLFHLNNFKATSVIEAYKACIQMKPFIKEEVNDVH